MALLLFTSRQTINFSTSTVNPDYLPCFRGAKSNRMRQQQQHTHPYSTFPSEMISQIYFDLHPSQTSYLHLHLPIHSLILSCFLPLACLALTCLLLVSVRSINLAILSSRNSSKMVLFNRGCYALFKSRSWRRWSFYWGRLLLWRTPLKCGLLLLEYVCSVLWLSHSVTHSSAYLQSFQACYLHITVSSIRYFLDNSIISYCIIASIHCNTAVAHINEQVHFKKNN